MTKPRGPSIHRDIRGAVMAEYAVILVLVTIGAAWAVAWMAVSLGRYYSAQQAWLLVPFP
jgi:Flp pilus assembly pilin Flp